VEIYSQFVDEISVVMEVEEDEHEEEEAAAAS
jgi:transcription elongation factor Elf1